MQTLINPNGKISVESSIDKITSIPDLRKILHDHSRIISLNESCKDSFIAKIGNLRTVYKDIFYQNMLDDLVEDYEVLTEKELIKEKNPPIIPDIRDSKKYLTSPNNRNYIDPINGITIDIGDIDSNIFLKVKYELIRIVLERNNDNRTNTAKQLGISIRTLRNYLQDYKKEHLKLTESNEE